MTPNYTMTTWRRTCKSEQRTPRELHRSESCDRLEAMAHPRCVGWGEIGLDYHYDNSPRDIQRSIFIRQLRNAVKLRKPITIHTREAEEDTERILKEEVPKDHRVSSDDLVGLF